MLLINGIPLAKSFIFNGGEVQIQLPELLYAPGAILVETVLDSSDKIMELTLVKEALDHYYPNAHMSLKILYLL